MKKQILEGLKTKFTGVSDSVLNRIAEKLAKTVTKEEDVATAVEGVTFQQVIDGEADRRATEATQSAVANYEKKHGLKDGAKVEAGGGKPTPGEDSNGGEDKSKGDEMPAWAKTIIDTNKALQTEIQAMKGEKAATFRQSELNKILKDAPEKIKSRYEKDFARINKTFESDDDFNAWLDEIKPDIEELTTEFSAKGGVVGRPKTGQGGGQGGNKDVSELLKARVAEKEAATAPPAIQGLPQTS